MIKTDILIIGAGPVGLFTVFEAGLMKLKCHLIDALPEAGGQLIEIYPKKPIYDIPGYPSVMAGELVDKLLSQAAPFKPGYTLGDRAETIVQQEGSFLVTTQSGVKHLAPVVIIAGGLGSFEPRKPQINQLANYEKKGLHYIVKNPDDFNGKKILISGGGDSALDWAIYFAKKSGPVVTLVHRSDQFRAHKDSVTQAYDLEAKGKMKIFTHAEVVALQGATKLTTAILRTKEGAEQPLSIDCWLPLFGLSPKLGPMANWGLEIEKNAIVVDNTLDYQTNRPGIFAVGDVNTYPGKLKLILCGFHEATLAVQSAYKIIHPDKRFTLKYTTVQGIQGF